MSTIYVVTDGCYSDFHVEGIFDDKAVADALVEHLNGHDKDGDSYVTEYVLNERAPEIREKRFQFYVSMQRDGTSYVSPEFNYNDDPLHMKHSPFPTDKSCLAGIVYASSKEHAVKIVNERRTQLIAQNEWDAQTISSG